MVELRTYARGLALAAALGACGGSSPSSEQSAPRTPAPPPSAAAPASAASDEDQDEQVLEAPPPTSTLCGDAARCFDQAIAVEGDEPARAAELFEAACELELPQACSRLADLYEAGRGVTRDDRRAKQLRSHACELGSTAACDAIGH